MLDRELVYQLSLERHLQLCKTGARKTFPACIWCRFIPVLMLLAYGGMFALNIFGVLDRLGFSEGQKAAFNIGLLVVIPALAFIGLRAIRARNVEEMKHRVDYTDSTHLRVEADGLSFRSRSIDYLVKWPGISQMFLEPDGVVVAHGALLFLVPDTAFADHAERSAFVRDVFARMSDTAQRRSETFLQPLLLAQSAAGVKE